MARIRSVHPDICLSESMAKLPATLERTFVRLWTHCDDYGRCVDNSRLIKSAIYPLLDDMTADVLHEELCALEDANLIVRYEVAGKRYLMVRSWSEYQHPNRPTKSKIPAPILSSVRPHVHDSEGAVMEQDVYTLGEGEATERATHALSLIDGNPATNLRKRLAPKPLRELG